MTWYLSARKSKENRAEFYDKTIVSQEFIMLKSELGAKKKRAGTEDFINSPMQNIVANLKSLLENLPNDEQKSTLRDAIDVSYLQPHMYIYISNSS